MHCEPKLTLFSEWQVAGGIERVMLNLAGGLAELGVAVDLVVPRNGGLYPGLLDSRVRLIDLNASQLETIHCGIISRNILYIASSFFVFPVYAVGEVILVAHHKAFIH